MSVVLLLILWQEETDSPCEGVLLGLGELLALIFRVRKPDKELLNQQSAVGKHVLLPVGSGCILLSGINLKSFSFFLLYLSFAQTEKFCFKLFLSLVNMSLLTVRRDCPMKFNCKEFKLITI